MEEESLDKMNEYLEKANECCGHTYEYYLNKAYYCVAKNCDTKLAKEYGVAVMNGTSEGFLLAGGACVAGCCAQMVGFAVISFRENRWGGIMSQGLGTSMLQMGNIVKKPVIWLAPTLASAVTGPISTMVFKLKCQGVAAGMGTCGLVGPIGVIDSTPDPDAMMWVGLVLVCVVLPAILSFAFNEIFRKLGWIQTGDMKIEA